MLRRLVVQTSTPLPPLVKRLGSGAYSVVNERAGKTVYKEIDIGKIEERDSMIAESELRFLGRYHPNVMDLHAIVYAGDKTIAAVMPKADTSLRAMIENAYDHKQHVYRQDPYTVKLIAYQIVRAVAYCNSHLVCHQDINDANVLIFHTPTLPRAVLTDFGIASIMCDTVGSRGDRYISWMRPPEILADRPRKNSFQSEVWAVAMTLYLLAVGDPLIGDPADADVLAAINRPSTFANIETDTAKCVGLGTLLLRMLVINPARRITIFETLRDPYFDEVRAYVEHVLPAPPIEEFAYVPGTLDVDYMHVLYVISRPERARLIPGFGTNQFLAQTSTLISMIIFRYAWGHRHKSAQIALRAYAFMRLYIAELAMSTTAADANVIAIVCHRLAFVFHIGHIPYTQYATFIDNAHISDARIAIVERSILTTLDYWLSFTTAADYYRQYVRMIGLQDVDDDIGTLLLMIVASTSFAYEAPPAKIALACVQLAYSRYMDISPIFIAAMKDAIYNVLYSSAGRTYIGYDLRHQINKLIRK